MIAVAFIDPARHDRALRLLDPPDRAFVQQYDLLRRRQGGTRVAVGVDRPAHRLHFDLSSLRRGAATRPASQSTFLS
jgi:hypothetical protein